MENKKKSNIKGFALAGGLTLLIGMGVVLQVVKVPMEKEVTISVTSSIESRQTETGMSTFYTYEVPEGYLLKFDEQGNPIGYKMVEQQVTLDEYIESKFKHR